MEPLELQNEDALYFYLKKFLKTKPDAVQLDGSAQPKINSRIVLIFQYSVNGKKYKIPADFTRKAAERFVALTEEHGSPGIVLKETQGTAGAQGLILADTKEAQGFLCYAYTYKASDKLKKAA
jgi:hypothetical protein